MAAMTDLHKMMTAAHELMALTGAAHGILLMGFDVPRNQYVFRWFAGGRNVGFRIHSAADTEETMETLGKAAKAWEAEPAGPDDDREYERLRCGWNGPGVRWYELRHDDLYAKPQQIA